MPGNPLTDISLMTKVGFVMKEGVVYKQDGKPAQFVANLDQPLLPADSGEGF